MKYVNAESILPEELLKEVQKFIHGEIVYIPVSTDSRKRWGESSGSRRYFTIRNQEIRRQFSSGFTIDELSDQFFLSHDSIKKIVYAKK
ncbi:DNA-binding NarL/FixJ family response regulator [Sporosarcina luteola]|nr:DNA-binding NarL/FixJ family response regulator [Sporosarcina luteola]